MSAPPFSYIVVEGPIGVGKTTLATRLAESYGGRTLLEAPQDNPFLERFYENTRAHALSTQLSFLLQRARQLESLPQGDMFTPLTVSDFLMEKDRLFAQVNLDPHEYDLYAQVYEHVVARPVAPDLVIYLQAPVSVLKDRIGARGHRYERRIDEGYLQRLVSEYASFFHEYDAAPLLIVNASQIDLAHNEEDYQYLYSRLKGMGKGRHYLNPLPL
ncbi:MAG: deoxynucleoside kinase [Gammaproteobacteria bacterium]